MAIKNSGGKIPAELGYLDTYEQTHDYDEYHFNLGEIEHDPYVLISAITALHGGEWTVDEVGGILQMLFEKQYILSFSPEQRTLLQDYFREEMSDLEDLITVKEFADFLGYNPNSAVRWCNKLSPKCFYVSGKYLIPKVCAIDFLSTDASLGVRRKSHKHQLFLSDFMNQNGITR